MVKAWRALPDFRGESGAKTWLFHIAVNTCRDMLRSGWMRMRKSSVPLEVMPELAGQKRGSCWSAGKIIVLFTINRNPRTAEAHEGRLRIQRLRRARAMLKIDMESRKRRAARVDERPFLRRCARALCAMRGSEERRPKMKRKFSAALAFALVGKVWLWPSR